ncbi:AIF_collapsed_G0031670.mRNA.1.CDS.1 [Saccharomyces cerevisiae]|nr:AIF_collapsed_G0031670.mRNA.1.CDS.1 [Saccharomyces cerevisiae]
MLSRNCPRKISLFQYFARCKSPEEVILGNCRAQEKALKNANAIAKHKEETDRSLGEDTKKQKGCTPSHRYIIYSK